MVELDTSVYPCFAVNQVAVKWDQGERNKRLGADVQSCESPYIKFSHGNARSSKFDYTQVKCNYFLIETITILTIKQKKITSG